MPVNFDGSLALVTAAFIAYGTAGNDGAVTGDYHSPNLAKLDRLLV